MDLEWRLRDEEWLRKVFKWLVRNRMGLADRSRPIGWVQQHNMAAYNRIVELCTEKELDVRNVRVWSGELFVGNERLVSCREIFDYADKASR